MRKKNYKILTKLFLDKLIPQDKIKAMPSFSQAVNTGNFYNKTKSNYSRKIFKTYLKILDSYKINKKIDKLSSKLPNLLCNDILIEYYCSKKVIKCLKKLSRKIKIKQ